MIPCRRHDCSSHLGYVLNTVSSVSGHAAVDRALIIMMKQGGWQQQQQALQTLALRIRIAGTYFPNWTPVMISGTTRQNATSAFVSRGEASDAGILLVSAAHSTSVITLTHHRLLEKSKSVKFPII